MTSPPPASLSAAPLRFHLLASTIQLSFPPKCCPVAARNLSIRRRFRSSCAFASHSPPPSAASQASRLQRWDTLTARFAGASNLPFLLIQLPQILLNYRNLVSGNKAALLAVPWLGMLTGLLGNMTLLSYFAKKKEVEAIVVQTLGVVSIYVVLGQLAMAEAMSLPYFAAISVLVVSGLVLNFVNYFGWLHEGLWQLWEDFITVAGISVLPQVMWSTFVPFIPKSILPGTICCIIAVGAIILARLGKLSDRMVKFIRSISGWTATLLFMWMPIAQMWTTYLNPDNIKGLSAFTILLGMIGNGLMIPRALFIRDLMWFTGASWASFLHGWGNLACMYYFKSISWKFFLGATLSLFIWTGIALWRDTKAYGYSSPMISLQELVSGT
ncbi:maltose excess protein 1-like, chloroplastic isoform X1 [Musa acuminata AAA Group]|uniref:maltose excess protein 1-like, chloroplastic isoform X1 n=1 Tax=Musa acuminata AAA Group TaxID=214697 RepID=UPI0031D89844